MVQNQAVLHGQRIQHLRGMQHGCERMQDILEFHRKSILRTVQFRPPGLHQLHKTARHGGIRRRNDKARMPDNETQMTMDRRKEIQQAYKGLGGDRTFYDGMSTYTLQKDIVLRRMRPLPA